MKMRQQSKEYRTQLAKSKAVSELQQTTIVISSAKVYRIQPLPKNGYVATCN